MENLEKLILENEKLIYKSLNRFKNKSTVEDLYQAGCLGIAKAAQNYNSNSKAKFSTYAYYYIIGEMKKQVREEKPFKVNRDTYILNAKIEKARDLLAQNLMRNPTDTELSKFLEIPEYYIADALNSRQTPKQLDAKVGDTNLLMHETINSPSVDIDNLIYIKTELENLEEPERTIMINRYYEDKTQQEIAQSLGLNQTDISRRETKVLSKIR